MGADRSRKQNLDPLEGVDSLVFAGNRLTPNDLHAGHRCSTAGGTLPSTMASTSRTHREVAQRRRNKKGTGCTLSSDAF